MTFLEDMAADFAAEFANPNGPGVAAVYTPKGGAAVDITLFDMPEAIDLNNDDNGRYRLHRKVAAVQLSDVADPRPGDTITLSGVVWSVDRIRSKFVLAVLELTMVVDTQKADGGRVRNQK